MLSGPNAFDGLALFIALRTWFVVRVIGSVSRLWSCLIVWRLFMSEVKFVGLMKCFLNEFAISFLEVRILSLNFMDRFGSVAVGSLVLRDLIGF